MISNEDIVRGNYDKVFTFGTATQLQVEAMLAPNVVLYDHDEGITVGGPADPAAQTHVAAYLIGLRGQPKKTNPAPDYREVGGAQGTVLCLNHMQRNGRGPAPCVDVVALDANQKVTQIDICFVQNSGHFNV